MGRRKGMATKLEIRLDGSARCSSYGLRTICIGALHSLYLRTVQQFCGVTHTVLTYSTFTYVTSTPVILDHSLLSVTNLVNVTTFTHYIACLFTAVTYSSNLYALKIIETQSPEK